jgi:predicted transposase YbfD/YdcC
MIVIELFVESLAHYTYKLINIFRRYLYTLHKVLNWLNLNTIVKVAVTRTNRTTGLVQTQSHYYICSLKNPSAERTQAAVRAHWGIENSLHWVLDMAMREDESRIRTDHAPANMAALRHIALNLIRSDKTRKVGIKISQHKAGWDTKYLERLLGGAKE